MRIANRLALPALAALLAACSGTDDPTGISPEGAGPSALVVPACVEFNVPALWTVLGAPAGHVPGQGVFTENGIKVSVHKFALAGGGSAFNRADIVPAPAGFGAGQVARVNNINLGFDFSSVGFAVNSVKFEWRDQGGHENLRINASPLHVGELIASPSPFGGVSVGHSWFWFAPGTKQGTTWFQGPTAGFLVGGQEFWLDNVCAYP